MRICLMTAAFFALASAASAAEPDRPTAILVSPIHEAQIVRADDGKDHVEYELLVLNVFPVWRHPGFPVARDLTGGARTSATFVWRR